MKSLANIFAPLPAILAIIGLLGILLWVQHSDERTAEREALIRDALWVEQTLRFQLDSETSRLSRLAFDLSASAHPDEVFHSQAGQLLLIYSDIVSIEWRTLAGHLQASAPPRPADTPQRDDVVTSAIRIASAAGHAVTTPPHPHATGKASIAFIVPTNAPTAEKGAIIATFTLEALLKQHVPWWIAGRRALRLYDASGTLLASRSSIAPEADAPSYSVDIGAPLDGIRLTVVSYPTRSTLAQNSVVVATIGLGLFAAAGLIARERQSRRRRAAEAALGEEHAFRRAMESSLQVGVRARDLDGRILYVNPAFCRLFGYTEDELLGRKAPMPYWPPEDIERTQRLHNAILAGQAINQGLEFTFRHKNGTRVDVLIYEAPLIDAKGVHRGWMGSFVDITERKRAEETSRAQAERMQHTARLVTVGEMASLIAHELNQPLAVISSFSAGLENILTAPTPAPADVTAALKAISASADRAGRIVRSVQDFVRRSEPRLQPLALREIVTDTLTLLEPELRQAHVLAETELQAMLPAVRADRVLIEQVLVNLVRNAVDAMRDLPGPRRRILIKARWPVAEGRIEVSIRDWGSGVDATFADKLFSPFVSTKSGGMGMGLTICRSILELHGSHLSYEPGQDQGSQFKFQLSAVDQT